MHKILWDSEIQTDHEISARRTDLVIINKNKQNLDLARELRKLWNMRVTIIPIVIWALGKGAERVGNQRMNQDHPN